MSKFWFYTALILLILLNGMGYTLIQAHFYLDREEITALYCVNKNKPELQCEGKCELSKRLSEAKTQNESEDVVTLEELQLTFIFQNIGQHSGINCKLKFKTDHTTKYQRSHITDLERDFFHPPRG